MPKSSYLALLTVFLDIGEGRFTDSERPAVNESYSEIRLQREFLDEYSGMPGDEVRHLMTQPDLCLHRGYIRLQIPRELERAIDGLTDGDGFVRRCAQPFIERYIHGLHRSFNLEEIAFGTRCSGSHTNRHT